MHFNEIRKRLDKLDTASLCDADKTIRVLDPGIRPIRTDLKLIGRAHTVSTCDDFLTVIKALKEALPDEVLVVDGQQGHRAIVGELFTTEALRKGLAGLIIDGAVRDVQTLRTLEIPVYSRFIFPNAGTAARIFETQISVICGGVTISPGEVLFGDQDGVIVASEEEFSRLIPGAEEIQAAEGKILARMAQGEELLRMLNFDEHFDKIRAKQESHLKFLL